MVAGLSPTRALLQGLAWRPGSSIGLSPMNRNPSSTAAPCISSESIQAPSPEYLVNLASPSSQISSKDRVLLWHFPFGSPSLLTLPSSQESWCTLSHERAGRSLPTSCGSTVWSHLICPKYDPFKVVIFLSFKEKERKDHATVQFPCILCYTPNNPPDIFLAAKEFHFPSCFSELGTLRKRGQSQHSTSLRRSLEPSQWHTRLHACDQTVRDGRPGKPCSVVP